MIYKKNVVIRNVWNWKMKTIKNIKYLDFILII